MMLFPGVYDMYCHCSPGFNGLRDTYLHRWGFAVIHILITVALILKNHAKPIKIRITQYKYVISVHCPMSITYLGWPTTHLITWSPVYMWSLLICACYCCPGCHWFPDLLADQGHPGGHTQHSLVLDIKKVAKTQPKYLFLEPICLLFSYSTAWFFHFFYSLSRFIGFKWQLLLAVKFASQCLVSVESIFLPVTLVSRQQVSSSPPDWCGVGGLEIRWGRGAGPGPLLTHCGLVVPYSDGELHLSSGYGS